MTIPAVDFEHLETNGISLRVAMKGEGPLCVLVNGWPELWLSWRHQIGPLVEAGYLIPGAGHWVQQERPDEVNQAILQFLQSLRSGR